MSDALKPDDERLTQSILARTSGSPCAGARERIVDGADGRLEPTDAALMRMHIAGCADCAALAAALRRLSAELPSLAEIAPDSRFLADVLAATSPRPSFAARRDAWLRKTAAVLLARPRIAWEGAYMLTAALTVAVLVPGSPLAGVPERVLDLVRLQSTVEMSRPVARLGSGVSRTLSTVWETTRTEAGAAWSNAIAGLERGLGTETATGASNQGRRDDRSEGE
jgi:anti-sigma factor RsiW